MDLNSIDALLQRYSAAESRVGANLHELDNHSTYQILRTDELRGRTGAKLSKVFKKAESLWELFGHLQSVLSRARTLRGDGRVRNEDRKQLEDLLTGPSVLLYTTAIPLNERDLLDAVASDETITIEQLLTRMRLIYEPIRDGVAEVEEVLRNILPRLDAADTTVARVTKEAGQLGVREPELNEAARRLDRLRRLSIDDPLAIPGNAADRLESQVRLAAGRVAEMKKGHDQLHGDLAAMAGLVAEVRTLRARAEAAREEALTKIANPIGLVRVPPASAIDGPKGLAEAAENVVIDRSMSWQAQRNEADGFLVRARRLRDQLRRAERSNRSGLNKRDELRGLLTAYRAKMAGVGLAENLVLREITDEAHNELYTTPTDLARAERLIGEVADALSGEF